MNLSQMCVFSHEKKFLINVYILLILDNPITNDLEVIQGP